MIVDEIKKSNIEAMKNRDSIGRGIFSVVLNKIKLEEIKKREEGSKIEDPDVVNIIQKTIKELTEEKENYEKANNNIMVESCLKQIEILNKFLPEMLGKDKIKEIILNLPDKSIPFVMKFFKANYNGLCDMRLVQETLREIK